MYPVIKSITFIGVVASLVAVGSCTDAEPAGVGDGDSTCFIGAPCAEEGAACCEADSIRTCVGGALQAAGSSVCLDSASEQRCLLDAEGVGQLVSESCSGDEACVPFEGCRPKGPCVDRCVVGETVCSADGTQQLTCQRVPPEDCAVFVVERSCAADNMRCMSSPSPRCVNECGGMEVLDHAVCEMAGPGEPPCGVYICDGPDAVTLDHLACHPGGAQCGDDRECASCSCQAGTCEGNAAQPCPEALACL